MKIAYLGDTKLEGAAAYLAGILTNNKIEFDYFPSAEISKDFNVDKYSLIILSDFHSNFLINNLINDIVKKIKGGTNLLMIGGWDSYSGIDAAFTNTTLEEVLPVILKKGDDRVNSYSPLVFKVLEKEHSIVKNLPWDDCPYVGGLNIIEAKKDAKLIAVAEKVKLQRLEDNTYTAECIETYPMLVEGDYGKGKVICLATDVAPHWIGGMVDWGNKRVTMQAQDAYEIEIGNNYEQFFLQVVKYVM